VNGEIVARDGERSRAAFAMVGNIAARGVPRWQKTSCFQRDYAEQGMVFTTGTGPSKNAQDQAKIRALVDAARNSRSSAVLAAHAGREGAIEAALTGLRSRGLAPLGIMVEEAGGARQIARRTNDLYRPLSAPTEKFTTKCLRFLH